MLLCSTSPWQIARGNSRSLSCAPARRSRTATRDATWLGRFQAYVAQHYTCPLLSVPQIAEDFAMSESTLLRQVKRLTGRTPVQYLQAVRMEHARQLIQAGASGSIQEVAQAVGYRNAESFSRCFKNHFGYLPSACAAD
ncbi:MAG: AraC family transcriptional regulator [Bacteroidetes bacterium]|nr:MAG: AraC family transcriptional regulator [Bacteroidota bacterium]